MDIVQILALTKDYTALVLFGVLVLREVPKFRREIGAVQRELSDHGKLLTAIARNVGVREPHNPKGGNDA